MSQPTRYRPDADPPGDPNLTVMPALSAPIDEHLLIPHPPRSPWAAVFWAAVMAGGAALVLGFAFLRASAFH